MNPWAALALWCVTMLCCAAVGSAFDRDPQGAAQCAIAFAAIALHVGTAGWLICRAQP